VCCSFSPFFFCFGGLFQSLGRGGRFLVASQSLDIPVFFFFCLSFSVPVQVGCHLGFFFLLVMEEQLGLWPNRLSSGRFWELAFFFLQTVFFFLAC